MKNSKLEMLSNMNINNANLKEEETPTSAPEEVKEVKVEKFDIKKQLDEKELQKLEKFKKMMEEHLTNDKRKKFTTDITLVRYLRARKWSKKKAMKMLLDTYKWREEFKPEDLTVEDIKVEINNNGKMYRGGVDKLNHPIIYMKPRHDNTTEREPKVKYLVYLLEKAIMRMEEEYTGVTQLIIVIDFGNYNPLSGVKHTGTNKEVLGILQDHYPERLFRAYILNQGWLMSAFWSVLNPFMDPKTKEKIQMLKPKTEDKRTFFEKLLEDVSEEELEVEYGGKNEFKWDYEREYNREENIVLKYPAKN